MTTTTATAVRIPVYVQETVAVRRLVGKLAGRKQNLEPVEPTTAESRLLTTNCGRYSSRCSYTRYEYTPLVRNFAEVDGLFAKLTSDVADSVTIKAPKGYHWDSIKGQLALVRDADGSEFHPSQEDLRKGAAHCRSSLLENRRLRIESDRRKREQERDKKRAEAERQRMLAALPSIAVTFADSRRAGNCEAGTTRFARMLGVDGELNGRAVPADKVMSLAARTGQSVLAERAVRAAWERLTEVCI